MPCMIWGQKETLPPHTPYCTYIKYHNPKSWWCMSAPVLSRVKSCSHSCVPFSTLCQCTQVLKKSQQHAFYYVMPQFFNSGKKKKKKNHTQRSSVAQLQCCEDSVSYQCHIAEPWLHPVCPKTAQCRQMCPIWVKLFLITGFKINIAIKTVLY